MSKSKIRQPNDSIFNTRQGTGILSWNRSFADNRNQNFKKAQRYIDSEVLRYCSAMVPFQTGMLDRSGKLGTVIGNGEVRYIAPYAANQYYNTATTRPYDSNRGGKWFERMKVSHKSDILNGSKKIASGG